MPNILLFGFFFGCTSALLASKSLNPDLVLLIASIGLMIASFKTLYDVSKEIP